MALPLKSGADLYNQQLIRAAIWNYSADGLEPSEYATGLIYFNTNPSSNMYQKLRFRTGTDWKTIAFAEDLDVATNKDFVALKAKVEAFLEGGVDSDGVLNKLSEIQAFLDNYSSATDLTQILGTKADKSQLADYLPLSGGELTNSLTVSAGTISSTRTSTRRAVFYKNAGATMDAGTYIVDVSDSGDAVLKLTFNDITWKNNTLLHSDNVGEYALKVSDTIAQESYNIAGYANTTNGFSTNGAIIRFGSISGYYHVDIHSAAGTNRLTARMKNGSTWSDWKTIAFTDSNVASATKLEDNTAFTAWGQTFFENGKPKSVSGAMSGVSQMTFSSPKSFYINSQGHFIPKDKTSDDYWWGVQRQDSNYAIAVDAKTGLFQTRYATHLAVGNGNVLIGTTDDNGAKLQVNGAINITENYRIGGYDVLRVRTDHFAIGEETTAYQSLATHIYGTNVVLRYGTNKNVGLILNSSGNVTIGASDLAEANYKLIVNGPSASILHYFVSNKTQYGYLGLASGGNNDIYLYAENSNKLRLRGVNGIILNESDGNVGIGTNNPQAKLHVSEDIVANGTIACKGVAAEGSADMGAVDMVYGTMNGDGSKRSWTFNHGLSSANLVVNVYEYNNGSWDMILTDVDIIGTTKVTVTFGTAPASGVQHKVVIIGGVGTEVIGS